MLESGWIFGGPSALGVPDRLDVGLKERRLKDSQSHLNRTGITSYLIHWHPICAWPSSAQLQVYGAGVSGAGWGSCLP